MKKYILILIAVILFTSCKKDANQNGNGNGNGNGKGKNQTITTTYQTVPMIVSGQTFTWDLSSLFDVQYTMLIKAPMPVTGVDTAWVIIRSIYQPYQNPYVTSFTDTVGGNTGDTYRYRLAGSYTLASIPYNSNDILITF